MINELVLQYRKNHENKILSKIIKHSNRILDKILLRYNLNWQIREEIIDSCRSKILNKTLKKFNPKRAKFQTLLYWNFRSEIGRILRYYNRDCRIQFNKMISIESLDKYNSGKIFQESIRQLSSKTSDDLRYGTLLQDIKASFGSKAIKVLNYLLMGYSMKQAFTKSHIFRYSEQQKVLSEIKLKVRELVCI